jgi:hypothetical protein
MHTSLTTRAMSWLLRQAWRYGCFLVLWGALLSAVQAQSTSVSSPNAAFSRPELAGLGGVVPTAPVRLRVWGFEVYDARLWTPQGFRHTQALQQAFALELQYLRKLEGSAIASRSIDEMRRVGSLTDAQAQAWLTAMREMFPNVSSGERITGINLPGVGAEFWVNGQRVGLVKDLNFARLFFGIWLDERTSEPKMRAQLLQGLQP